MLRFVVLVVLALAALASVASAHPLDGRAPDSSFGRDSDQLATASAEEPALVASPRPECGPGSRPETGIQGRVPAEATDGFACNLELLGRQSGAGGYKVHRFVDKAGRECAYYDTTLLFPLNAQNLSSAPTGVAVLDMSDPSKPVRTATLVTPAMQSPHESLVINERRGLLVAVMGNPAFAPGVVDVYDLNEDCRAPALQASLPVGLLGHESGFAPDGNTFYATSLSTGQVTAVDLTNPKLPTPLAVGEFRSHGLTISEDGNRGYVAASGGLTILDTSEIQSRKPNPRFRVISELTWPSLTIPQVAIPVTIGGKPFLVEVDEFSGTETSTGPSANGSRVGAGRIIDIADETKPRVVSNFRLAVNQPENRAAVAGDPGAQSIVQGYAGHYCAVPRREEPGIVACGFIASGLRVFDIRDPAAPKEVAYYVAPRGTSQTPGMEPSNYAMSAPAFVPERREIWHSDGNNGFFSLRMAESAWPAAQAGPAPATPGCTDTAGLASATAVASGRGVSLRFTRRLALPVRVDVFRVSQGRRVVRERLVARFDARSRSLRWNGVANRGSRRAVGTGYYFARFTMLRDGKRVDVRRVVLRRGGGRFTRRPDHYRRDTCDLVPRFKLERPVFGGPGTRPLRASYRLARDARVTVTVTRGSRVVARFGPASRSAGRTHRITLPAGSRARGDYRVRLDASAGSERLRSTLTARRL